MSKDNLKYSLNYYLIHFTAFVLPLHKSLIAPCLGFLFLSSIWNFKKPNKNEFKILLLSILFVYSAVSLLWTSNLKIGLSNLETNLSMIIIPIALLFSNIDYSKLLHKVMIYFIEGLIFSILISFAISTYGYFSDYNFSHFLYGNLSYFHHPSYMSMYCVFSISYIYYISFNPSKHTLIDKRLSFLLLVLLSFYTMLILSKTGILLCLGIHFFSLGIWILKLKKIKLGLIALGSVILIFTMLFSKIDFVKQRFVETFETFTSESSDEGSTGARLVSWNASINILSNNPLLGVGVGDINSELQSQFMKMGHNKLAIKEMNSHNQYLQTLGSLGIIGFSTFIIIFLVPFYYAKKHKFSFYFYFLTIIVINFLTESMLQTQSGVIFIVFFNTLFMAILLFKEKQFPNKRLEYSSLN